MEKNNIISKGMASAIFTAIVLTFSACSAGGDTMEYLEKEAAVSSTDNTAASAYSFVLKALSGKSDVTTHGDVDGVTLFVFDENYEFVETKEIDKATVLNRRTIKVTAPGTEKITVVAWAGLTNNKEEVSSLNQNSILSDLRVQLKQSNGQVTTPPSDLFYGQISIDRASMTRSEDIQVLSIERKVAEFSLTTTGIAKQFGTTAGDFYYIVRTSTSVIDHNGEYSGTDVEYTLPAQVNNSGNLTAEHIAVLPSDDITIELYRDDIMVMSSKNLRNTENLSISASEQLDIVFDINKSKLSLLVAAWGQIVNRVQVG